MKKTLLIATTYLCRDGLTEIVLRILKTVPVHQMGIALAEGCDPGLESELGKWGTLYFLPSRKKRLPFYMIALRRLIAREGYQAVHIHGNSATMAFDLLASFWGGASIRITHVHNCAPQPLLKQKTLGTILNRLVTCPVACSEASGRMLYTKPFTILTNGVDCLRFSFNAEARHRVRRELGIEDAFVVGHIGRFSPQKNQRRLLRIFSALVRLQPNSLLLLCGEGEDFEECRQEAERLNIAGHVLFPGKVDRPQDYYQAMDVFVLPSLFEGLPLVGVEAQASGLPCVFSDTITKETGILPQCAFVSLADSDEHWADTIINIKAPDRASASQLVAEAGYTEQALRQQIMKLYDGMK